MTTYTATYSPDDNKLRLYASQRLDAETYARVKAAGFKWAPQQQLFVAPMWTPSREDLLIELAGEIDDEDKSLAERAEERAERFEDYSDSRATDAEQARKAVAAIADNIPFGQPILVGHHSERHARKDAERIQNGMRKAIRMWDTAKYWQDRARGAIGHAKYKERPDVRARRIKTIEADKRKVERSKAEHEKFLRLWSLPNLTLEQARQIANVCHLTVAKNEAQSYGGWSAWDVLRPDEERYKACPAMTVEQVQEVARRAYPRAIAGCERWIAHYENRLAYERAMLAEVGGTVADKTGPEKGGAVRCWASPGYGKGWAYIQKVNKVTVTVLDNWGNGGRNFTRNIPFDKLLGVMTAADVATARADGRLQECPGGLGFYLGEPPETRDEAKDRTHREYVAAKEETKSDFDAMRETLKAGVKMVSAPQLFPTPPALAARMVELARLCDGDRVLEPSAGTGAILAAMREPVNALQGGVAAVAVELNTSLCDQLRRHFVCEAPFQVEVVNGDFLQFNGSLGKFDRVLMNPPFERGADIEHILHARHMLKEGGKVIAICANGPRQREALQPIAEHWEDLPAGTFKDQGTNVNTALVVLTA